MKWPWQKAKRKNPKRRGVTIHISDELSDIRVDNIHGGGQINIAGGDLIVTNHIHTTKNKQRGN